MAKIGGSRPKTGANNRGGQIAAPPSAQGLSDGKQVANVTATRAVSTPSKPISSNKNIGELLSFDSAPVTAAPVSSQVATQRQSQSDSSASPNLNQTKSDQESSGSVNTDLAGLIFDSFLPAAANKATSADMFAENNGDVFSSSNFSSTHTAQDKSKYASFYFQCLI